MCSTALPCHHHHRNEFTTTADDGLLFSEHVANRCFGGTITSPHVLPKVESMSRRIMGHPFNERPGDDDEGDCDKISVFA